MQLTSVQSIVESSDYIIPSLTTRSQMYIITTIDAVRTLPTLDPRQDGGSERDRRSAEEEDTALDLIYPKYFGKQVLRS